MGIRHFEKRTSSSTIASIGFNPEEQKWYGWSHRACYGFGAGSEVKIGDCAYIPTDKNDFLKDTVRFWNTEEHLETHGKFESHEGIGGVRVYWTYAHTIPNEKLRRTIDSVFSQFPDKYGNGEWVAKTLDDAKQMVKDFAAGVS